MAEEYDELRGPVTSLHFWVINTNPRVAVETLIPVNSRHFWVINTCSACRKKEPMPVNSRHFWVINTPMTYNHLEINKKKL